MEAHTQLTVWSVYRCDVVTLPLGGCVEHTEQHMMIAHALDGMRHVWNWKKVLYYTMVEVHETAGQSS